MSRWAGSRSNVARMLIRQRGRFQQCWRCGTALDTDLDRWTAGHLIDRVDGGTDTPDNIAIECPGCNFAAGGRRGAATTNRRRGAAVRPSGSIEPKPTAW